jgi:hypothetical protein
MLSSILFPKPRYALRSRPHYNLCYKWRETPIARGQRILSNDRKQK